MAFSRIVVGGALVLALAAWRVSPERSSAADHRPSVLPAGTRFVCTPTRVWDGDGPVWCAEGVRVRLSGIAAREMDGTCRSNQPCPNATAEAARDKLVELVSDSTIRRFDRTGHAVVTGAPLSCLSEGSAGGTRTAAWCTSAARGDLSCAMVKTGTVLRWGRYWKGHQC